MKPNVLVVVLDAVRQDHTSVHGYDQPTTPNLERLASDGVRFDSAFAAAPWTPPSHGSLFAGVHPTGHGFLDGGMRFDPPHRPLAERLRTEGYRTFGAAHNVKISGGEDVTRGFEEFGDMWRIRFRPTSLAEARDYYLDLVPAYVRTIVGSVGAERKPVEHLSVTFVEKRIERFAQSDSFFGFVNINAPHSFYAPPEPYRGRFETSPPDADPDLVRDLSDKGGYRFMAGEVSPTGADWSAVRSRYDGEIAFADALVGQLLDTLRREGVYDDTLVVVTADHGEQFGEHGLAYHQFSLFDELIHVPLVVKPPGGAGDVSDSLVSLVDVYPTILRCAGISIPDSVAGRDLLSDPGHDTIFAEYGRPRTAMDVLKTHADGELDPSIANRLDHALQCARSQNAKYVRAVGGDDATFEVGQGGSPKDTRVSGVSPGTLEAELDDALSGKLDGRVELPEDSSARQNLRELGYL